VLRMCCECVANVLRMCCECVANVLRMCCECVADGCQQVKQQKIQSTLDVDELYRFRV
jgi:hypothetical protein